MKGSPKFWLPKLHDFRESVRKRAENAFCSLTPDDHRFVPELIEALQSGDPVFGYWAARGLSQIGPAAIDALPALIKALNTDDDDFLFWVILALGAIGPQASAAISKIIALLNDQVIAIRQTAANSLVRISPSNYRVVAALIRKLKEDEDESTREEIVRSLGRAGTPEAVKALAEALEDRNPNVQLFAAIGLKVLGFQAVAAIEDVRRALASTSDDKVQSQLAVALRRMGEGSGSGVI